jgi:hypothetical protein
MPWHLAHSDVALQTRQPFMQNNRTTEAIGPEKNRLMPFASKTHGLDPTRNEAGVVVDPGV